MALEYQHYQNQSESARTSLVQEAQARLEHGLQVGPDLVRLPHFFRDVYLLTRVGFFNIHPESVGKVQQLAAHPGVRRGFLDTLRAQDTAEESQEVLASISVGETFEYHLEGPFKAVFDTLAEKHKQLIEEAERKKAEAERKKAEAERKKAEAAASAKQRASSWGPPESNIGKSPEWVAAQEKVARLWADRSKTLPQGLERETQAADLAYLTTGFNILHEEILSGSTKKPLEIRAMLEFLIPKMWRQPRMVELFFKNFEKQEQGRVSKPANLSEVSTVPKLLFIPSLLKNLTTPSDKDQSRQIRTLFRMYSQAMHTDVMNNPDSNKDLLPHVDIIHKAVNSTWKQVRLLLI